MSGRPGMNARVLYLSGLVPYRILYSRINLHQAMIFGSSKANAQ